MTWGKIKSIRPYPVPPYLGRDSFSSGQRRTCVRVASQFVRAYREHRLAGQTLWYRRPSLSFLEQLWEEMPRVCVCVLTRSLGGGGMCSPPCSPFVTIGTDIGIFRGPCEGTHRNTKDLRECLQKSYIRGLWNGQSHSFQPLHRATVDYTQLIISRYGPIWRRGKQPNSKTWSPGTRPCDTRHDRIHLFDKWHRFSLHVGTVYRKRAKFHTTRDLCSKTG